MPNLSLPPRALPARGLRRTLPLRPAGLRLQLRPQAWPRPHWPALLDALGRAGTLWLRTGNEHAELGQTGQFRHIACAAGSGLVIGQGLELSLQTRRWHAARRSGSPAQPGLDILSADAQVLHRLEGGEDTDIRILEQILCEHLDAAPPVAATLPAATPVVRHHPETDGRDPRALRADWDAMARSHDFHRLLQRHRLDRLQALRLAGPQRARAVAPGDLVTLLAVAHDADLALRLSVGNAGVCQSVRGRLGPIQRQPGGRLLLRQPGLHLSLDTGAIASAWVVTRPDREGPRTSLELFDRRGDMIALLASAGRGQGTGEDLCWRVIARALEPLPGAA